MLKGAKIITKAMRQFLLSIDPVKGLPSENAPTRTKRACASRGFVDYNSRETWPTIFLTETGKGIREILVELEEAQAAVGTVMKVSLEHILERTGSSADFKSAGAAGAPTSIGLRPDGVRMSCGTTSSSSFDEFASRLNAAGLNRWSMVPANSQNSGVGPAATPSSTAQRNGK